MRAFGYAIARCFGLLLILSLVLSCGSSGPPPSLEVVSATDLGAIGNNPKILGRDGGSSGLFAGKSVWTYGDTFLAQPNAEGQTLISDSWAFTTDLNAAHGITGFQERDDSAGAPAMLLTYTAVEQAFNLAHEGNPCQQQPCGARWALWPATVVSDPARNRALIFYQLVSAQPGSFNFFAVGYSVAIWQNFTDLPQRPVINPAAEHPDLLFGQNDPPFGTAAVTNGDTVYIYACNSSTLSVPCIVGRVALEKILDLSAWTFYAGGGNWSSQMSDAVSVLSGGSTMNISWNDYLKSYVAVYSPPFSYNVMVRTAPNPEGPWSAAIVAFNAMTSTSGSVHDAQAHPEYNANGGQTMFVSYSRSTGTFTGEVRLVALELKPR